MIKINPFDNLKKKEKSKFKDKIKQSNLKLYLCENFKNKNL